MARASDRSVFAAAFVLWGINFGLPGAHAIESNKNDAAQTDDGHTCLSAPHGVAPKGQHWYYRNDRQTGRKCWYAHAGGPLPRHAAAPSWTRPEQPAAVHPNPAANPTPPAPSPPAPSRNAAVETTPPPPAPARTADVETAAPLPLFAPPDASEPATAPAPGPAAAAPSPAAPANGPHIEILRTVPTDTPLQPQQLQAGAPAAAPTTDNAAGNRTGAGALAARPPIGTTRQPGADTNNSGAGSNAGNAVSVVPQAPADGGAGTAAATPHQAAGPPALTDTITTLAPTEMFFLVATALSFLVFLVAIASRITAQRREPIITEFPQFAWSDDPVDPVEPMGFGDSEFAAAAHEESWDERRRDLPDDRIVAPRGPEDPPRQDWPREETTREDWIRPRPPLLTDAPAPAYAGPSEDDPDSLEPVLRILRRT